MGFSFLAPLFLAGAAALAIPLVIHLTHRERREAVRFPSLMFLRQVPYRTTRRQRIRHWLLFLLRAAAVLLLVLAFARPLLDRGPLGAVRLGTARDVVILLDRSYSMTAGDRWARATGAVERAVGDLGADDQATLVTFAASAEAVTPRTGDRAVLRAALDGVRAGGGRTAYGPALQLALDLLEPSELPRREVVVVTDFQRVGWLEPPALRLPAGTVLSWVDVGDDGDAGNVAVTDVLLERRLRDGRHEVVATARLANLGPARDVPVLLEIDGRQAGRRVASLPADGSGAVRFEPVALPERVVRGAVRAEAGDDRVAYDDAHRFTVQPVRPVPVLVLRHPAAPAAETVYLRRALEIGMAPPIDLRMQRIDRVTERDVDGVAVVVLLEVALPDGSVGRRLREFVANGGGVLLVLGSRTGTPTWPASWADALGDPAPPVTELGARGGAMSVLGFDHPVFAPFGAPRSGDFSAARFFRYRRAAPPAEAPVLARFDDGGAAVYEAAHATGRVLVWPSGLDNVWNDFPVQPVFLPFVHEAVRYLARYRPGPPWYRVGETVDLGVDPDAHPWGIVETDGGPAELVVETPAGERVARDLGGAERQVRLEEHGFYEIRDVDRATAVRLVAVNADPAESDLARLDPEELAAAVAPVQSEAERRGTLAATLTPAERERRQGLWWYLLLAVVILGLAETVVAGRLPGLAR